MKTIPLVFIAASLAAITACERQASIDQKATLNKSGERKAGKVYSGAGTVQSVSGDQIAIAHGPIAGIGWPAMTMTFTRPPQMAADAKVGDQVNFSFRQSDSAYVLTSLQHR